MSCVNPCCVFEITFSERCSEFEVEFGEVTIVHAGFDPYPGPYTVIPHTYDQVLPTKSKHCIDDITVTEIPYTEVSNIFGTTVAIANE